MKPSVTLKKIKYDALNSKQKEIYNFQKVAAILADYGYNCIKLSDDWQGADFIAYHKDGNETLKVQLKSRMAINTKYIGKDLYMCFPIMRDWYLIKHDDLIEEIGRSTQFLKTESWIKAGSYSTRTPPRSLIEKINSYKLDL